MATRAELNELMRRLKEEFPGMYAEDRDVPLNWDFPPLPPDQAPPSIWDSPDDQMYYGPTPAPVIPVDPDTGKAIVEAERIPWQGNPHKDQDGWGTEPAIPSKTNVKKPDDEDDDDFLNQLMMSALMAGGKKGKMGQLGGAAGGGISFGDPWTMQAPWEKDYRYLS